MVKRVLASVAIAFVCSAATEARVTRIEITKIERVDQPSPGADGAIQPYERLSGRFYGELDPADSKNAVITDIQLAARNARGKVEYVGTFSLMKPVDGSKVSGVMIYSVVNRGNGTAAASAEGHLSLVSGWQGDVVPTATNQTIRFSREELGRHHRPSSCGFSATATPPADDSRGTRLRIRRQRSRPRKDAGSRPSETAEGEAR